MAFGKCFLSGEYGYVERHHIFGGPFRQKSEKYGLVVELAPEMHREGPRAAHRCKATAEKLKSYGQMKVMLEQGWDRERFIREFGKNYLSEEDLRSMVLTAEELCKFASEAQEREGPAEQERKREGLCRGFRVTIDVMPF